MMPIVSDAAKAKKAERDRTLHLLEVHTSGTAAKLCRVAARTVSKWCESGVLKHYRIPGSQDRRIHRDDLLAFAREGKIDWLVRLLAGETVKRCLFVDCAASDLCQDGWTTHSCDAFNGLVEAATNPEFQAVVVHAGVGMSHAKAFAATVRAYRKDAPPFLVIVVGGDEEGLDAVPGFDLVLPEPLDAVKLWAAVAARETK